MINIKFKIAQIFPILGNRTVQTILVLLTYILLSDVISIEVQQLFYTISLLIKELLIWIMPLTIGAFIANSVSSFEKKAISFILIIVIFEALSNFCSVWYVFFAANFIGDVLPPFQLPNFNQEFKALWYFPLVKPYWWSSNNGVLSGIILGAISAFNQNSSASVVVKKLYKLMEFILTKIFARLIPIFILGFAAHMYQLKILNYVFIHYAFLLNCIMLFLILYTLFLFALGSGCSVITIVHDIKNLLPAGFIALSSGCSLSTMPWTIEATAKNLKDKTLAMAVIPATTNIQQVGDCIINAFLCFLIYRNFYGHNPDFTLWLHFTIIFTLARFVTAAVIGGAIFIMLPIYETYLHFNPEMIAIIMALNVVLDPIVTSFNVIANGALCKIFEIVWNKYNLLK